MRDDKEKLFDNLNIMQAVKKLNRINFEAIYNEKEYSNRKIILNTEKNSTKLSILQKFHNIIIKQDNNGNIELNINGTTFEAISDQNKDFIINGIEDIKNIKMAISIAKNSSKTNIFLNNHCDYHSSQGSNNQYFINGKEIKNEKSLANVIYEHIDKMNNSEKNSLAKAISPQIKLKRSMP